MELPLEQVRRVADATGGPDIVSRLQVPVDDVAVNDLIEVLALLGLPYNARPELGRPPGRGSACHARVTVLHALIRAIRALHLTGLDSTCDLATRRPGLPAIGG